MVVSLIQIVKIIDNIEIIVPRRLPSSCSDVSSGSVKFSKNKKYRNIKKVHIIAYVRT